MKRSLSHSVHTLTLLVATTGVSLLGASAANANPEIQVDRDGSVQIDRNVFELSTDDNQNSSDIPIPENLIESREEGVAQPVNSEELAPNSLDLDIDTDEIDQQLQPLAPGFEVVEDSLQITTQFDLEYLSGQHAYGEGIQVTVYGPEGEVKSSETAFIRGDQVEIGPDGNPLPEAAQINTVYEPQDTVELRVLTIRGDYRQPQESGLYFTTEGEFAVEDLPEGGDLDFNDGAYSEISGGQGEAEIVDEFETLTETISYRTQVVETPLDPLIRRESVTEAQQVQLEQTRTEVDEDRQPGQVEITDSAAALLPHATGVATADGEQLIYDRYRNAAQVRLGTDGASLIGQSAPLVNNPAVPPTLITGAVSVHPGAEVNEAGISGTVGITQYLNPTHQDATDMYGDRIVNPNPDGPRLVQPTGLINNTRLVGYVPPTPNQTMPGERLTSTNGVFEVSAATAITIAPPNPSQVGLGEAAYTGSVGGLIIEKPDGTADFIPQWSPQGYATEPITLEPGSARQIVYALVPEQAGLDLQLGQAYALNQTADQGYHLVRGGFQVISADQHPENFRREMVEVYAVEDTLPGQNFTTDRFNGIRGLYQERPDGSLIPTVDLTRPEWVDARVGNQLSTPDTVIPGDAGQMGYYETTLAGGLYVRGGLSLGLGNQEDIVTTTTTTVQTQTDVAYQQTTTDVFATPRTQVETRTTAVTTEVAATGQQTGTANFAIAPDGTLGDVNVQLDDAEVSRQVETQVGPTTVDTTLRSGPEQLAATTTVTSDPVVLASDTRILDRQVTVDEETYPNVSPLQGELAVGGILNIGNTPWTPAANTLRAELFMRGTVMGEAPDEAATGWRVEAVFNPFGERQRPAYGYDQTNQLTPIYQTEPLLNAEGDQVVTQLTDAAGQSIAVKTYQFLRDEMGDRIPQMVGTGQPIGPGIYLRVEDVFNREDDLSLYGGIKFDF